jgi:hypothetical protein
MWSWNAAIPLPTSHLRMNRVCHAITKFHPNSSMISPLAGMIKGSIRSRNALKTPSE